MINLLYSGNQKVFDGLITSLLSIVKTCKEELKVYILTADLTEYKPVYEPINEKQITVLNEIVKKGNPASCVMCVDMAPFKSEILNSANADTSYSPYSYLRLFSDELKMLPEKILYLDVDIMANKNISELYNKNIDEYEYAGVLDYYGKHFISPNYVNSGVLLLNLKKIKETKLFKKCRDLLFSRKLFLPDQNAINQFTTANLILPDKYNSQKKIKKDTVIRHFSKTIKFFPVFHTLNVKQWQIDRLHKKYKCHDFDDVLKEYLEIMNKYNSEIKGDLN